MARLAESVSDIFMRRVVKAESHGLPAGLLISTWVAYALGAIVGAILLKAVAAPLLVPAAIVLVVACVSAPMRVKANSP